MGKLLDDYLLSKHKDKETISKGQYKKLLAIESEINHRNQIVSEAQKTIKDNQINIKAIAEATNISRKTFYNNELLNEFVSINSSANNGSIKDELKKVKSQLQESESKVKKLVAKDINVEELKHTIANLEIDLNHANERVEYLENQLEHNLESNNENIYHINLS